MQAPRQIWRKLVDALFPTGRRAEALYAAAVAQARRPSFYAEWGVPDTPEGRFGMIALHVILLLDRLMQQAVAERDTQAGAQAAELARALQERLFDDMDASLREMGVSDVAVPKRMRRLATAFYGRMRTYHAALAENDMATLKAAFRRHIFEAVDQGLQDGAIAGARVEEAAVEDEASVPEGAVSLAAYALKAREMLQRAGAEDLRRGHCPWPPSEEMEATP